MTGKFKGLITPPALAEKNCNTNDDAQSVCLIVFISLAVRTKTTIARPRPKVLRARHHDCLKIVSRDKTASADETSHSFIVS